MSKRFMCDCSLKKNSCTKKENSMPCICKCGRPIDCGEKYCALCDTTSSPAGEPGDNLVDGYPFYEPT